MKPFAGPPPSRAPPRALQPLNGALPRKFAHSERFAFPRITAPAARKPFTTTESAETVLPTSASEPAVVSISIVGREVVLHQHRNTKEWSAQTGTTLGVPIRSDRQCVRISLDHGMKQRIRLAI